MTSTIISLTHCSNEHAVLTLLGDTDIESSKFVGKPIYKAYVIDPDNTSFIGHRIEHSRPFKGWVKIKTDINALCDNK